MVCHRRCLQPHTGTNPGLGRAAWQRWGSQQTMLLCCFIHHSKSHYANSLILRVAILASDLLSNCLIFQCFVDSHQQQAVDLIS